MKLKRVISIVLIGLFTSLFGAPLITPPAFAGTSQAVNSFTSSCSGNVSNGTFNANANFSTSFDNPTTSIERWEYSYDKVNWIVIADSKGVGSSGIQVSNWYANSFSPWVRNVSNTGVNGPASQPGASSSTCSGASLVPLGTPSHTTVNCDVNENIYRFTMSGTGVTGIKLAFVPYLLSTVPASNDYLLYNGISSVSGTAYTLTLKFSDYAAAGISAGTIVRPWFKGVSGAQDGAASASFANCAPPANSGDVTAPTLSSLSASSVTNTSATLNFTSNEAGTYYYLVYPATQTAPASGTVALQGTATAKGTGSATAAAMTNGITGLVAGTAYKAYVVVKDAAGNTSTVSTVNINTTVATPATPDLNSGSDLGTSATDDLTSDNTPTFSVSGTLSGTGVLKAVKAGETDVICTLVSGNCTLGTLVDGTWSVTITDTAGSGLSAISSALSIVVDTSAPTAALTAGSIVSSENAAVTSSEVGIAYLVNNAINNGITVTNLASITGAADSSWNSVAITTANTSTSLAATGLTPGTYRLYTADAAGNLSAVSTNSVTVTLAAPGAPDLVAGSDLGSSSTDNTTNYDTPEISITGLTIGAVITLTATPSSGTAVVCTFTATATTGSCPFTTLANGTYSVAATQTFNSVTSNAATLTGLVINKTTIATPSTPDLDATSDSGSSATDNVTSDKTPKIDVTGPFSGTAVVTATKTGSTSVSCTISSETCTLDELSDGTWSISVTVTDSAGNATTSVALLITVDSTVPTPTVAATSVTTASGVTVRSSEVGTAYLVKTSVTVTDLASITGSADNSMNLVAISTAGTDTAMSTDGLLAGDYKLYVVDAAGNISLASANTVTVAVAAAPTSTSTSAPTGTTTFGSTLTNAVTFAGVPTPTQLNYQWKSCASATDTTCTDIAGATSSSFIANAIELVGKFIRVLVTAINGIAPNGSALSSPTAAITAVAPGVPVVGTPTVGDLQINVPFTAPTSNGGSTITKYQFSTDGGVTWSDRTDSSTVTSPIAIKFLSTDGTTPIVAGTTYPIQIRAVNTATNPTGAATASVSVKAVTVPGAPTAVTATATGQTTATVSFTAPANNGGSAITTYTITSSPGGITASGSTSPISVTGLSASTTYTFTVTANNGTLTSVPSAASSAITTSSPPPAPVCDAACVAAEKAIADAAAKAIADAARAIAEAEARAAAKVIADAAAKAAAEKAAADAKIVSDAAAKAAAAKITVDKSAAEAAAKAAVEKAVAAAVAKAAADAAAVQAAVVAKAAAEAQLAAVVAAEKAAAALKSATASAATKAAATVTATKAATVASNTVQAAATAAKVAATAKATAANAAKQVDIAIGALGSKTAAAATAAQANAIAAAAKIAANAAAKAATDQAAAAKVASNNAIKEAANAAARIATEQKEAADAAAAAKVATDLAQKATEEKIAAAAEAQKAAEAVVKALEEKIALADASVKAQDITERAAIDKKIDEITAKVADAQRVADAANVKAVASVVAQEQAQTAATASTQQAVVQATEAVAVRTESVAKAAVATKAAADATLAAKVATAAVAAAAKVPAKAVIAPLPSTPTKPNSAKATITGLKPGQKVKVTVNVKGK